MSLARLGISVMACVAVGCAGRASPRPFPTAPAAPAAPADAPAGRPDTPVSPRPEAPVAPRAGAAVPAPADALVAAPAELPPSIASALIATALTLRGAPYRNGGASPSGFDCSGFVQYVFAQHGQRLPREVRDQYQLGAGVARDEVQPGDLLFFQTVSPGPSHVGIAVGGDEFVHAPSSRGVVRVERYTASYWSSRWVGARRVRS